MDMNKLLTASEVAENFGVRKDTVYLWLRTKGLPHMKLGGRIIRFGQNALNKWIAAQQEEVANG